MRPADIKSREVELGSHSWMDSLAAELFLNSCFLDTVFVALFHTTVETAFSKVHKLLGTGGVPTSLTALFWRWPAVSLVFAGRGTWTSYSSLHSPLAPHPHPLSPSLISLMVSMDVKRHDRRRVKMVAPTHSV